jgi:dTDP-4-dehydrorhamnose 3,5-epimerase-like enzyme
MKPKLIKGSQHTDTRGTLTFNNDFNVLGIKRFYTISNASSDFVRGWQGHLTEQRWFSAVLGSFKVQLIKIDNWENPSKDLEILEFILNAECLDILHVPKGFISAIQATEKEAKLLVFSDYQINEIQDEFRFPLNYFNKH